MFWRNTECSEYKLIKQKRDNNPPILD